MDGPSQTVERTFAAATRRLVSWAARTFVRLVFAATLLLILIALLLGVTDVGRTGIVLLGTAATIVIGHGLRLTWPYVSSVVKRIRVRFSLRTLLVMTVVSGIGLAWLGNKLRDVRQQRQILGRAFDRGLMVGFDDAMPGWWYKRFGWNGVLFWGNVGIVCKDKPPGMTADDLKAIEGLRYSELLLSRSGITDPQLRHWTPPKELRNLKAQLTGFNDNTAVYVSQFKQLEELDLWGASLTDAGIAHLARLPQLHTLGLARTPITDDAVKHLKSMMKLQVLTIWQSGISPQGIEELKAALPNCTIHH